MYFKLLNTSTLPSERSAQCSRFRKIRRGEWLTQSPCMVARGTYQITIDGSLGETLAVLRYLWLKQPGTRANRGQDYSFSLKERLGTRTIHVVVLRGGGNIAMDPKVGRYLLVLVLLSGLVRCSTAMVFWTALLDISYSQNNKTVSRYCECGVYGRHSPLESASGIVALPILDAMGCSQDPFFSHNTSTASWIALIKRGNCTFSEKINAAKRHGAAAVVVYNVEGTGNSTTHMAHSEAQGIVAIMVGNTVGMDIANLVKSGLEVHMVIEVGSPHGPWMDKYWLYFLSIAFFIVTAASIAYFVFISAHRLHNLRAQRQVERRLKSEAKKAIGQLEVRTLKRGDEETGSDDQTCAVCIESYKAGDVVTVLTCGHIFHKACIEPWLLDKRTCPMCKCDILKALGVEEENDERSSSTSAPDVTVITVSGEGPLYEVPLTEPRSPEPQGHPHHYDNKAFEGDTEVAGGRRVA